MKVLCTGANGFIGKHLVTKLKEQNHTVTALPHMYLTERPDALDSVIPQQIDWIFHLAAYGNMSNQTDVFDIFNANLAGTFNLLQATRNIPYKAFINISTSSVTLPHQTMYSATKLGAEALCRAYFDEYKKPIVTVRPYSVYGPGEAPFRFIPTVFRSCLKGEMIDVVANSVHDWVFIDDVIRDMINCASEIAEYSGEIFHSGTGVSTTNLEIMRAVEGITRKDCQYRFVENMRSFDNSQWINKEINAASPRYINIYEGLQKYYESLN